MDYALPRATNRPGKRRVVLDHQGDVSMRQIYVLTALLVTAVLTGCDKRPVLPSQAEAGQFFYVANGIPPVQNEPDFVRWDVQSAECAFGDPPKSAITDQWMAHCEYELKKTWKSNYKYYCSNETQSVRIFYLEKYNHEGDSAWVPETSLP